MSNWASIAVVDCGGPYTLQLVRRLRELGVPATLYPATVTPAQLPAHVQGIVVSGGQASIHDADAPSVSPALFASSLPLLAIGYGLQAMNRTLGGRVQRDRRRQYRLATIEKVRESPLLQDLGQDETVWMNAADDLIDVATPLKVVARTREGRVAVVEDRQRGRYGLQFHPEVTSTPCGRQILANFALTICALPRQWALPDLLQRAGIDLRRHLAERPLVMMVSGGLASMAAAALVARTVPAAQVTAVHVDTGLLRHGETDQTIAALQALGLHRIELVDARADVRAVLADAKDAAAKDRCVRAVLASVADQVGQRGATAAWQLWGTTYLDRPQSGEDPLALIERLGERLGLLPGLLREEWRHAARLLGLPADISDRSPLPPAGLAASLAGGVTEPALRLLSEAGDLLHTELRRRGLGDLAWQLQTWLDQDPHEEGRWRLTLRLGHSADGMTEGAYPLPWEVIDACAALLRRSLPAIGRVVWDVTRLPADRG